MIVAMLNSFLPSLATVEIFGQRFDPPDLAVVLLLVVLEGVLSIDNALVLGLLAKRLPKHQQSRALTYGLVGAFLFRSIAIGLAAWLLAWRIVKLLGGGYLVYVALKHFWDQWRRPVVHDEHITIAADGSPRVIHGSTGTEVTGEDAEKVLRQHSPVPIARKVAGFWSTVAVIELTDIAFAVDSILAAIALVGAAPADHPHAALHPKMWVIVTGGMLGVILMRFAAVIFIRLLERFPRFETSAYLLVIVIGVKLLADWAFNRPPPGLVGATQPATMPWHPPLDFHSPSSWAFWVFWAAMAVCFVIGFLPQKKRGEG